MDTIDRVFIAISLIIAIILAFLALCATGDLATKIDELAARQTVLEKRVLVLETKIEIYEKAAQS